MTTQNLFQEHFPTPGPVLLAVIHAEDNPQALRNAYYAFENGADGIFLIGHNVTSLCLHDIYLKVRATYRDRWIGMNFLRESPEATAVNLLPKDVDGFWTDNAGFDPRTGDTSRCQRMQAFLDNAAQFREHRPLWFGGVSFKRQHDTDDIFAAVNAANACKPFVDVITTSGSQTGMPPEIAKIKAMRLALGERGLAIASGITPENVDPFLEWSVSAYLVATGINQSFTELDPKRVRALADKIHALRS